MRDRGQQAVQAWQQTIDAAWQQQADLVGGQAGGPGQSELDTARDVFFGDAPPGSDREILQTDAIVPGGQDGIIVSRFCIANEQAAFGTLHGDGRGPTTDPAAGHRFSVAWDTRTGEVSLTVNESTLREGTRIGEGPILSPETPPDVHVPALPITTGEGGAPNNFVVDRAGPDGLTVSYNVLNSVYPAGEANGTVDLNLNQDTTSVRLTGDDYPDGEFVQYRPEGTRLLGDKPMHWLQEGAVFGVPYDETFTQPR